MKSEKHVCAECVCVCVCFCLHVLEHVRIKEGVCVGEIEQESRLFVAKKCIS